MATKSLNKPNSWQKQVNPNTRAMKQLMRDVRANTVRLTRNSKDLDEWLEKLAPYTASNCFITGAHADQVKDIVQQISGVVNQTSLPSGSNAEIVKGTMAEACMTMVTNVGEDIKTELSRIAVESYNNKLVPAETARIIGEKIDSLSKTRCQAIARTETCRAANIANYLNAKEMGAKSYSVICNEGACPYCIEEYGEDADVKFDIEDTDSLPPFHPNCRCTPVWSMDPVESDELEQPETTDGTENTIYDVNSMVAGSYETFTENDRRSGAETTVYKFENGLEIGINSKANLSFEEIKAHIGSLPQPLRNIDTLERINICGHYDKTAGGRFYPRENKVEVYLSRGNKVDKFNTLNHELAHALDHKLGGKTVSNYGLSKVEIYEKIFKADNKLYTTVNERTGRKRTPKIFVTDYAARSFSKYKRRFSEHMKIWKKSSMTTPAPHDFRYGEDFADSTKRYLNPATHEEFTKKFPNRAKYLEEIYGKPVFNENNPINQAIKFEEKAKLEREAKQKKSEEQTKIFQNLSRKEFDSYLGNVVGKENIESYYTVKKELDRLTAVRRTLFTGEPKFMIDAGYTPSRAIEYANNPNPYLKPVKKDYEKAKSTIDNINNLIKQKL